jgi:acylphosphatase
MQTWKLTVTGRVQGVGFRWSVLQLAKRQGVNGYVKNNFDGSVTIVAQAPAQKLAQFQAALPQAAAYAKIGAIQRQVLPNEKLLPNFRVKY